MVLMSAKMGHDFGCKPARSCFELSGPRYRCLLLLLGALLLGCGEAVNDPGTGGVPSGSTGFVVVNSDYYSTSVSLLGPSGEVLSRSFISSASAAPGLSAALGGDVGVPSMRAQYGEIVVIDRRPAAVLSWVNLETGKVRAQLSVATGFASNPHDYVWTSPHKAYVTRYDPNLRAGKEAFDQGSDLLILDPSVPKIRGRLDLSSILAGEDQGFYPYPERAILAGGLLRVLALSFKVGFMERLDSRLISIDPESDEIVSVHRFEGLHSCSLLSLAPSGSEIAVGCNGAFSSGGGTFQDSGIVLLDVAPELAEKKRFLAEDLGGAQVSALDYASDDSIVYATYGRFSADLHGVETQDTVRRLDLASGRIDPEPIAETRKKPFSFGDVRCDVEHEVCVFSDAETNGGVVRHFEITSGGKLVNEALIEVDTITGLPPRYLGRF
jgi:hypothetical protein